MMKNVSLKPIFFFLSTIILVFPVTQIRATEDSLPTPYDRVVSVTVGRVSYSCNLDTKEASVVGIFLNREQAAELYWKGTTSAIPKDVVIQSTVTANGVACKVTTIEDEAFFQNFIIKTITLPSTIKHVKGTAFQGMDNLVSVKVSSLAAWMNIEFDDVFGNPLMNRGASLVVGGTKLSNLTIPKTCTEIKANAFCGGSFASVTIPENVTKIGRNAFWHSKIDKLNANGSPEIGQDAFDGCDITTANYPNMSTLFHYGKTPSSTIVGGKPLATTGELVIPGSVKEIPESGLDGLHDIESLIIEDGVERIGAGAFGFCYKLKSIKFGNTLKEIGEKGRYAFSHHSDFGTVTIPNSLGIVSMQAEVIDTLIIEPGSGSLYIDIPNCWVKTLILHRNLEKGSNLQTEKVIIGSDVTDSIWGLFARFTIRASSLEQWMGLNWNGNVGFAHTPEAYKLIIGDQEEGELDELVIDSSTNTSSLTGSKFRKCSSLRRVSINAPINSIGEFFFEECENLTDVIVNAPVDTIKENAFKGCKKLQKITVTQPVKVICSGAFDGQKQKVKLLADVDEIQANAFKSVDSLVIDGKVGKIGSHAFCGANRIHGVSTTDGYHMISYDYNTIGYIFVGNFSDWLDTDFSDSYANPMSYSQNLEVQELEGNLLTIPAEIDTLKAYVLTIPAEIDTLKPYVLDGNYFKHSDGRVLTIGLGGVTIQFLTETPPGISKESIEWRIIKEIKVPDNCGSVYMNAPVWKDHRQKIAFEQSSSDSIKEDKARVRKLKFMKVRDEIKRELGIFQ